MPRTLSFAVLLLLAPLTVAIAQTTARGGVDANHDGNIDRAEAAAHPRMARAFDALDRNNDGLLNADERTHLRGKRHGGGHGGLARLDSDNDGRISRGEFAAVEARRAERMRNAPHAAKARHPRFEFDAIDANRDGYIVRTELRAFHDRMRPQRQAERTARFNARFAEADLNRDGRLGRVEVQEKMPRLAERFDWMDDNRDGFLSRDELKAGRRHR